MAGGSWQMVDRVKIQRFEDLGTWQESQNLAVKVYKLTAGFPQEEKFGLTNQLRRAASSVSANIAEGFGRQTQKDKLHFYIIAYGSLLETKSFLYLANKLKFVDSAELGLHLEKVEACQKLLNALMSSIRKNSS